MALEERFFATDLFRLPAKPAVSAAWRRLQMGDPEGAAFLLDGIGAADAGAACLAQLRAAVSVSRGDAAAAAAEIDAVLPCLSDAGEIAALSFQSGICHAAAGDAAAAHAALSRAAHAAPRRPDTRLAQAEAAWDAGGPAAGRAAFRAACAADCGPGLWTAWARRERGAGETAAARAVLDDGLARHPDDPDLLAVLAAWFLGEKRPEEALGVLDRLPGAWRNHPVARVNRGNALLQMRRFDEAEACFAAVLADAPDFFEAQLGIATVAFDRGEDAAAQAAFDAAARLRPGDRDMRLKIATLYARTRRISEAEAVFAALLAENPDDFAAHYQLAVLLYVENRHLEAETHALAALALDPAARELYDLLGLLQIARGDIDAATASFGQAMATVQPKTVAFVSNWLYLLNYSIARSPAEVAAAHRAYGARFGGRGADPAFAFANDPDPERPLRVGYVSPDFRAHSVSYFMAAVVRGHDRAKVRVYAYSFTQQRDRMTGWLSETADAWRDVAAMTWDEIRERIRADGIDILVDLAGHTGNNLLPVLARRAAPVQVSWLGYPNTTGLPAMDYRIVDAVTDPPGEDDALATEELVRLPRPFVCYRPVNDRPEDAAGPMAAGGPFTFGSFNAALKLNDRVFDAWARILAEAPDARLLLKAKQYANAPTRDWVLDAFAARGIAAERLVLRAFTATLGEHLGMYGEIDLALDTFPYNGTTTTCEAMSMGVPVLSLRGDRHAARVGETLLSAVGVDPVFLADDVDDYVFRAVGWAARRTELDAMRRDIRWRLEHSLLCDEAGQAAAMEDAYRAMWRRWCAAGPRCGLGPSEFDEELRAACAKT
ncbi:tetratricopeptide repeat protein [Oleispirillum naphthae]|uniref:O-linked N-acetylglucosamine transferase, SPINDLY family protein n=1 Tax=Oleispirillum naphthae TaxID=2838853 RepID=UPI00308241BB